MAYLRETQKIVAGPHHPADPLSPRRHAGARRDDPAEPRAGAHAARRQARGLAALSVIDCSATPMGARLLSEWLTSPLTSTELIAERLEAVEELFNQSALRGDLRSLLGQSYDLERLAGAGRHRPGDAPRPGRAGQDARHPAQAQGAAHRPGLEAAQPARGGPRALPRDPRRDRGGPGRRPAAGRQGRGPDPRRLSSRARTSCAPMPRGASRGSPSFRPSRSGGPGIQSLKVGFNKVFGYYIEITHAQAQARGGEYSRATTSASRRSRTPSGTSRPSSRSTRKRSSAPRTAPASWNTSCSRPCATGSRPRPRA